MRVASALLAILAIGLASSCSSHEPFCTLTTVHCVETCGGSPFIQCGACPDGSVPVEDCADAGD